MSEAKSNAASGGVSFLDLLTVLFVGLKLTAFIDWPWWLVLGPLWMPWAALLAVLALMIVVAALADGVRYLGRRRAKG